MEIITTEEVIDKVYMFQAIYGRLGKFGWWYLGIISADAGTQFTSTEFQYKYQSHGVGITLAAPEHQKMNGKFEWHEECCVQLHTHLWYIRELRKHTFI